MMRKVLVATLLLVVLGSVATAWAWRARQFPIISGEAVSGTIWVDPPTSPSRSGSGIETGSRVDVHEGFIVVVTPRGERIISPHGWYSNLRLKP